MSGPPCRPGKIAELIFFPKIIVIGKDHAAARTAQRFVCGVWQHVVVERIGMNARGNETGEMGHVHHEHRADLHQRSCGSAQNRLVRG